MQCAAGRRSRMPSPTRLATLTLNGDLMVLVKIWLGAVVAIVLFLTLTAIEEEHAEKLDRCAVNRCV